MQEDFGGTAFIYALWVEPQARRKGEAKKLLERAEDIAREAGHKAVRLEWHDYTPKEILYWYMRNGYDDKAFDGMGKYVLLEKILQP